MLFPGIASSPIVAIERDETRVFPPPPPLHACSLPAKFAANFSKWKGACAPTSFLLLPPLILAVSLSLSRLGPVQMAAFLHVTKHLRFTYVPQETQESMNIAAFIRMYCVPHTWELEA